MPDTFVSELEEIVDEVAVWGRDYITAIVDKLAPDGRPFGTEKMSLDEQLEEYRKIRNDVEAWKLWIQEKTDIIMNMLTGSGVSPEQMALINPLQIASAFALDYSIRMESHLSERMLE